MREKPIESADYILQNSKVLFPYLCIVFVTLALVLFHEKIEEKIIVVLSGIIVFILYHSSVLKGLKQNSETNASFKEEVADIQDIEFVLPKTYKLHQKPKRFIYIYHNTQIMEILNDLSFVKRYDDGIYEQIIVLIEGYLKIYYGVLDGKYIDRHYFAMMTDVRNEIMSLFQQLFFNVPITSKNQRRNLHEAIEKNMLKVQSLTYHHLKIVSRKCKKETNIDLIYEPPYPQGTYQNDRLIHA